MKVIHKYTLNAYPTQQYFPVGAEFLCVQAQNNTPKIWFIVDSEERKTELHRFVARATGEPFQPSREEKYLGTFQLDNGHLVFHVFELL